MKERFVFTLLSKICGEQIHQSPLQTQAFEGRDVESRAEQGGENNRRLKRRRFERLFSL